MQLVDVKLGAEGDIKVDLVSGVLQLELDENTAGLQGGLKINIPVTYFLDALAAKANSSLVTSIVAVVDGIVKGLP